jgi:hypothetical protein
LRALERRVIVKRMHIQQAKLEADGGSYKHRLQLEGAGMELVEELTGVNLSEEEDKKKSNDEETIGVEATTEWQAKTTRDEEDSMGD